MSKENLSEDNMGEYKLGVEFPKQDKVIDHRGKKT
jgi:hypothetical protein